MQIKVRIIDSQNSLCCFILFIHSKTCIYHTEKYTHSIVAEKKKICTLTLKFVSKIKLTVPFFWVFIISF